jgi:hypothetical protein
LAQAKKLLEDFCCTIPKLFIIIDGLDACEKAERSQLLDILTKAVGQRDMADPGTIRLLIASQDYTDIRRGLHSSVMTKIVPKILQILDTDNETDIQAYTRMWVDRIATRFPSLTDDMQDYLRNLTVANAKGTSVAKTPILEKPLTFIGMFLYAKLVLPELEACTTLAELLHNIRMENFPPGLAEV